MDAILQFLIHWTLVFRLFYSREVSPLPVRRPLAAARSVGLRPGDQYNRRRRQCCRGLPATDGAWHGMGSEYFHVKEKMDRAERFVHGPGCLDRPFFAFILFWEVPYPFGHDAPCTDCHSRYDHRKDTRYALLVWGKYRKAPVFNALKL